MTYSISELLPVEKLKQLLENFHAITNIAVGVADTNGNFIIALGWKEACTQFHRKHPVAQQRCVESDTLINESIGSGKAKMYKCKNGLWDVAKPIIIEGNHIGTIYFGQFFMDTEEIDEAFFKQQAAEFGFDVAAYIQAIHKIPRYSGEMVKNIVDFFVNVAESYAQLGFLSLSFQLENRQLSRANEKLEELYKDLDDSSRKLNEKTNEIEAQNEELLSAHEELKSINQTLVQTNNTLIANEQKYRNLVENSSELICEVDINGYFTFVNSNYRTVLGFEPNELIGKPASDFIHPDEFSLAEEKYEQLHKSLGTSIDIWRFRTKSGQFKTFICKAKSYTNELGNISTIVISRDITEEYEQQRQLAQLSQELQAANEELQSANEEIKTSNDQLRSLNEELQQQKLFFEQLYLQSATSTQILDTDGWCVRINNKLSELLGVKPEDIEGKKYNIFHDAEVIKHGIDKKIRKVMEEKTLETWDVEFDIVAASNSTGVEVNRRQKVWFYCKAFPIIDAHGKILYIIIQHEDITENKRNEQKIKESEEKYRTLVETSAEVIWETNMDGKFTYVSPQVFEHYGYTPEEWIGKSPFDFMLPEKVQETKEKSAKIIAEKESFKQWINFYLHKNGSTVVISANGTPIFDEQGNLIKYRGTHANITKIYWAQQELESLNYQLSAINQEYKLQNEELNHANEKLALSEEKYRNLVENLTDVIYTFDKEGHITFMSAVGYKVSGYSEAEIIGRKFTDFVHPDDYQVLVDNLEKTKQGVVEPVECRLRYKNDNWHWIRVFNRFNKKDGTILGVMSDITDKKMFELRLIQSEKQYEQLFQSMFTGFALHEIICNADGEPVDYRFLKVNKKFEELTGLKAEEIIGKTVLEILPNTEKYWIETYGKVALTGEPTYIENFSAGLNKYFEVSVYSPQHGQFATIFSDISERINRTKKINTLAYMLDIAPSSITVHDENGNFLFANAETFKLHGYTAEEFMQLNLRDVDMPESAALIEPRMQIIKEQGEASFEVLHKRKDGTTFTAHIYVKMVEWEGKPAMLSVGTDITEQKKAAHELQQKQDYIQALLYANPDLMFVFDKNNCFIDYKAPLDKLLEMPDNFIGKNIFEVLPTFLAEQTNQYLNLVWQTGEEQMYDYELTIKDEIKFYESRLVKFGEDKALALIRDITEQRRAERALMASEQQFRSIWEHSNDGMRVVNDQGKILLVNPAFCELFEMQEKDLIGNSLVCMYAESEKESFLNAYLKKFHEGEINDVTERKFMLWNGKEKWLNVSHSTIQLADNTKTVLSIFRDISDYKIKEAMEQEVAIANRTAQLKQQFLANMSHEIRTPLNGIIGIADFLARTPLNETQLDYAKTIQLASQQLLHIVNDILDLSKIEAGKMEIVSDVFSISNLKSKVYSLFAALIKNKKLQFEITSEPTLPEYLYSDEKRIFQIINNLLSNAIKFTAEGEIKIHFTQISKDEKFVVVKVSVSDTGIGISEENKEKIFNSFTQIDSSFTRKFEGTGLGLTICKHLVQLLGGNIGVESEPGKGSTFWFTFKAEISLDKTLSDLPVPKEKPSIKAHVLLVEDMYLNRRVIELMLRKIGCTVDMATNGVEALEIFQPEKYDIIFMDVQMPQMDGVEAVKQLKSKYEKLPPIIGLSANALEGDAERYMGEGMDDYLPKPVTDVQLHEKLSKWVKQN